MSTSNHSIFEKNHFEIDNCIITRYIFVNPSLILNIFFINFYGLYSC